MGVYVRVKLELSSIILTSFTLVGGGDNFKLPPSPPPTPNTQHPTQNTLLRILPRLELKQFHVARYMKVCQ